MRACLAILPLLAGLVSGCGAGPGAPQEHLCEVHQVRMQEVELSIRYGTSILEHGAEYFEAQQKLFPHNGKLFMPSCGTPWAMTPPEKRIQTILVWRCPACEAAASRWDSEHLGTPIACP